MTAVMVIHEPLRCAVEIIVSQKLFTLESVQKIYIFSKGEKYFNVHCAENEEKKTRTKRRKREKILKILCYKTKYRYIHTARCNFISYSSKMVMLMSSKVV